MDRVNGANWIDLGGGKRGFRSRDTVQGLAGTEVTGKYMSDLQEEVCTAIETSDLALDGLSRVQLAEAIRRQRLNWRTITGTAASWSVTLDPAPASYAALLGVPIRGIVPAPTGPVQANVNGLGAVDVTWPDGTAIASGDYAANSVVEIIHDGTAFRLWLCLSPTQVKNVVSVDLPILPEVLTADGRLTVSASGGVVTIAAGQTLLHRGTKRISTTAFSATPDLVNSRAFSHAPSKTYHGAWYAGAGNGGLGQFTLRDLADPGYNGAAYAEADAVFDSVFDKALLFRLVTDAGNNATLTLLANKDALVAPATRATAATQYASRASVPRITATLNWGRTPQIALKEYDADVTASNEQVVSLREEVATRYAMQYEATGYVSGGQYCGGRAAIVGRG